MVTAEENTPLTHPSVPIMLSYSADICGLILRLNTHSLLIRYKQLVKSGGNFLSREGGA